MNVLKPQGRVTIKLISREKISRLCKNRIIAAYGPAINTKLISFEQLCPPGCPTLETNQ